MSPMTPTPEPAVGQVYELPGGRVYAIVDVERRGDMVLAYVNAMDWLGPRDLARATYLGTLDELREHQALRAEVVQLRKKVEEGATLVSQWREFANSSNTAVNANLEAENAKLRAALKRIALMAEPCGSDYGHDGIAAIAQQALTPTPHE